MRGPIFCYCKIVGGKIVHCALHDNATYLVGVCEHIHALLRELDIRDAAEKARIDQVVLPFIERTINFAMKEQKDGFGNQYIAFGRRQKKCRRRADSTAGIKT